MNEDFKTFSQGYDGGYHDGYLACGEKWLSKIEDIKAEIDKHKLPCCFKDDRGYTHFLPNVIKVDDVLKIIDGKGNEVKDGQKN